jgi:hypothetical protein
MRGNQNLYIHNIFAIMWWEKYVYVLQQIVFEYDARVILQYD